jgi:soluble lytic murein transglycosylase-like protein
MASSTGGRILRSLLVLGIAVAVVAGGLWWAMGVARDKGLIGPVVVPQEYRALIREAAATCPKIPTEIFAAQIAAESSWDPSARSGAGARGIAQFMPAVWEQYGLDANDDGERSVWDPVDAIFSAARLNCVNRTLVKGASGNRLENTLAAYNAGFGAVMKYDGIPPYPETEAYVKKILATAKEIQLG